MKIKARKKIGHDGGSEGAVVIASKVVRRDVAAQRARLPVHSVSRGN